MPTRQMPDSQLPHFGMHVPLMDPHHGGSRSSSTSPLPALEMCGMNGRRISCESLPAEKTCFICLDGSDGSDDILVPCCTRCFALCHTRCWSDWRISQANHARRSRLAGNRVSADPFLCSICKTGSARIGGERVTVRWLESFANFARSNASHQVRFASGLFSALSGARAEGRSPGTTTPDDDPDQEEDFFDFMDTEISNGGSSLYCNAYKFFLLNICLITSVIITCMTLTELGISDGPTAFMGACITLIAYIVLMIGYVIWRFQQIMTSRHLGGS